MKVLLSVLLALFSGYALGDGPFSPSLIGGTVVDKAEWPEVVYIQQGSSRCTASFIGPRTIITAGHCVPEGGIIKTVEPIAGAVVSAKCSQHPLYRSHAEDMDFALCKTDVDVDVKFATVSKVGPALNEIVTLAGYGCTQPGGGSGNDGKLRVGEAKVNQLPSGASNWYFTLGRAALCFGDSGGPNFRRIADPKRDLHVLMGINSRGNITDLSLLAALYIEKAQSFFREFAASQGVEMCGINRDCGAGQPPEPPQPEPAKCKRYKRLYEKYKAKYEQCVAVQKPIFDPDDEAGEFPQLPAEL